MIITTTPLPAAAQEATWDLSLRTASGRYTLDETVTSVLLVNQATLSFSGLFLEAALPVVWQDSADVLWVGGGVMPVGPHGGDGHHGGPGGDPDGPGGGQPGGGGGGGKAEAPGPAAADFDHLGVGDLYLTAGWTVVRGALGHGRAAAFASVKVPIADRGSGFGTGEWDAGAGVALGRTTDQVSLQARVAWWTFGDTPELELDDALVAEVAALRSLAGGRWAVGASAWGRTRTVEGVEGPVAAGVTVSRRLTGGGSVYATAEAGLTESAPDVALVLGWRAAIGR